FHPAGDGEEAHAYQNDETDRRVGSREIVTLGELVDELPESAEVDEKLDADDVDQREDEPEPDADEHAGQRRGKQDLPELLGLRELEAAPDVDQYPSRAGEPLDGLEDDGGQGGDEADHHHGHGAAAEDHEEEGVHQHERRGRERRDPGLAGEAQQPETMEQHTDADADDREQHTGGKRFAGREQEAAEHVLLGDYSLETRRDLRGQRHDEAVDAAGFDQHLDERDRQRQGAEPERRRRQSRAQPAGRVHGAPPARRESAS